MLYVVKYYSIGCVQNSLPALKIYNLHYMHDKFSTLAVNFGTLLNC